MEKEERREKNQIILGIITFILEGKEDADH